MSRCSRLLTCASTACNAVHMDVSINDASLQSGQHSELDASGKAARISEMLAAFYRRAMRFGQSIDEIMLACDTEILRQVDNPDVRRNLMLLKELLALAVSEAKEDDVHLVERHFRGEAEVSLANQSFVDFADGIASVRLAIGKDYLRFRVPQKHSYQFAASISCSS